MKQLSILKINQAFIYRKIGFSLGLALALLFNWYCAIGQTTTRYQQFSNEFSDVESLGKKWTLEFNLGQSYTSIPPNNHSPFAKASQFYLRGWAHYYPSARWKLSYFLALFGNVSIPDIEQAKDFEIRYALQGTYYINKIGYSLLTRFRLEDRRIQNDAKTFEAYYRLRTQLKYTQPINGKVIRKGIYYAVASDELFVKTQAAITGKDFFDRNRLTLGGGYALTDDTQVELLFSNEWLPRSSGNLVYNTYQINFSFTDLFRKFKDKSKSMEMHSVDNGN
ncbi:MAG: hypothetical protein CFE25_04400 [Chitinophagaceae bacterium BSSC1]|nr:MAG: hypothetical protein CFE25_04400 [Chitinophagaceae bacterium BSSC1]